MTNRIHDLSPEERPRERLQKFGAAALNNAELLALFFRVGSKNHSAIELGRELLRHFPDLATLSRASLEELQHVHGIGPAKACELTAAFEFARRIRSEQLNRQKLDSAETVYEFLAPEMQALRNESLRVILLDTKLQPLRTEQVSQGSLNESVADLRDIFHPAILLKAYGFILAHNHPSGDPAPSNADRHLTRKVDEAAGLLNIRFCDHVIIGLPLNGRPPYFSFREHGLL